MTEYAVTVFHDDERGMRVECEDHGEGQEFQPGYRTVAFHCDGCGYELELTLQDTHEWRGRGEMC